MADSITRVANDKGEISVTLGWANEMMLKGIAKGPVSVTLGRPEEPRSVPVNAKFHCMISDIRHQAMIHIPGRRIRMADYNMDEAKALLVMWFARERDLNGDPLTNSPRSITDPTTGEQVQIRPSTAQWGKRDASDFVEWLYALGSDCKIQWSEPAMAVYEQYAQEQNQ